MILTMATNWYEDLVDGIFTTIGAAIDETLKNIFVPWIRINLEGAFDTMNTFVTSSVDDLSVTPMAWNGGALYTMVQNVSEAVVLPLGGVILTIIMCYELISMIIDKNNMHDFPPSDIMKWIFKTTFAITLLTESFTIIGAIFQLSSDIIVNANATIGSEVLTIDIEPIILEFETLYAVGSSNLWFEALGAAFITLLFKPIMFFTSVAIYIIIVKRMIEIYCTMSLAPIPFATLGNKEWSTLGTNYIKTIFALGFQGLYMTFIIAMFPSLFTLFSGMPGEPLAKLCNLVALSLLLFFTLKNSSSLTKSIFNTH